jgi:hypothetical protein
MSHMQEEQLMDAYYGDVDPNLRQHLQECAECSSSFERLKEILDSVREYPVPERGDDYGREVWARLLPQLPRRKQGWSGFRGWAFAPALAAMVVLAFVAGMLTQRQRQAGFSAKARERVLLIAVSDHLERSQIVLAELLNAGPTNVDLADQRERARDLVNENRLLRQTALHMGDASHAALLDDLERVLLDIANSPNDLTPGDLELLQRRIESQGLLFKVRVTSTDAREKGQKL